MISKERAVSSPFRAIVERQGYQAAMDERITLRAGHKQQSIVPAESVQQSILMLQGHRVMLDSALAKLYGVETKALNRAVKRNLERFPAEFMFQLTQQEAEALKYQIGTSKGRGGRRYLPYAFTEHGAVMLASVLSSPNGPCRKYSSGQGIRAVAGVAGNESRAGRKTRGAGAEGGPARSEYQGDL